MEFIKILPLRGPNIWTYRPVVEIWLDIGVLEDSPSNLIPGFYERLTAWLPALVEHRCGIGERGGFLLRLREGTWPGHILEHVTIELQNLAGMQTGFGKARSTSQRGIYKVAVRSRNETVTLAALEAGRDLVMAAIRDEVFDVAATVTRLHDLVDSLCIGPSTACIVNAASERGIPSIRLTDGNLVQLGYGINQRRIWTAETDQTSAIAEGISKDKDLSKSLLSACGVPVPEGRIVDSPSDAWDAAEDIGLPVVVKPSDANHGRGVSTELMTRSQVETAFQLADAEGSEVIVERYIRGNEHRLLVVGGYLAAAARGESLSIFADGRTSIQELVDTQVNTDPRRGQGEEFPLSQIVIEEDATVCFELERQGFNANSIPPAGTSVLIQRNGNVAIDETDEVHPEVAAAAVLAARVIGLDIAGVDVVAEDISKPLSGQGGAIVEVNAGPGLLMHLKPAKGQPRPVGKAIVDSLFKQQDIGRIPVVGISGTDGKSLTARILDMLLHLRGNFVGLACAEGLYLAQRQIDKRNCANWTSAQKVLMNRSVDAAVIENSFETILGEGLGYDRCRVGIITNIDAQRHFGKFYIESNEQVCNVYRTQVDVVLEQGVAVLNADDPLVAAMAEYCDGEVMYFAQNPESTILMDHVRQGGRALTIREGKIVLITGERSAQLIQLSAIPLLKNSNDADPLTSVLAALGAAWALGVTEDLMYAGMVTFEEQFKKDKA
jgi:cyanophycin synthetase